MNPQYRTSQGDGNLCKDCLVRRKRWRNEQGISFESTVVVSIDDGDTGNLDHTIWVIQPFHFD